MPTLPGLTINDQAVWDRVYAAFDGDPQKYKDWLKQALQDQVRAYESRRSDTSNLLKDAT